MPTTNPIDTCPPSSREHLRNVADNLQLIADMGYSDVALAVLGEDGVLTVAADARPNTAIAPHPASRVGRMLERGEEPEAYRALEAEEPVLGDPRRVARGIKFATSAWPIGDPPRAVIVRDLAETVSESSGAMESAFMEAAEDLLEALRCGPLVDYRSGKPFATMRRAGDGVMRVSAAGYITYASPNAVNIMRLGGVEGALKGAPVSLLPGAAVAITPVLGSNRAMATDVEVGGRVFRYRTMSPPGGALVLVEDLTEAVRREQEIRVKEATIREVHHRVKNNLQTIASLLRIQARRSNSDETRHALAEATERVSSMAVVHDLLAMSDKERVDFADAARTIVELVRRGFLGEASGIEVGVEGHTGEVDARTATALALTVAELVHNALEHGFAQGASGRVDVAMRKVPGELVLVVRDDGKGLPSGFDPESSANLGLTIVRTVIEDDLGGTIAFSGIRGTTVTVRVPFDAEQPEAEPVTPDPAAEPEGKA